MEKNIKDKAEEVTKDPLNELLQEMKASSSPKDMKKIETAINKIKNEGLIPYEAFGLNKESIEFMYSHAYGLYNAGKYEDAKQLFFVLDFLNPEDKRFTYSIAACLHMMKRYSEALSMYLTCMMAEPENPLYFWHIADCYLQMDKKVLALLNLKMCIRFCEDASTEPLKIRAEKEYEFLELQVEEEAKKQNESEKLKT